MAECDAQSGVRPVRGPVNRDGDYDDAERARGRAPAFASVYEDAARIPDEAFKTYFEPLVSSEERSNSMRRFLSLGNLNVLTSIAPQLRELQVPTLIVWGDADTAFDLKSPQWLKDNIGGVRRLVMVPRAKLFFPEEHPKLMSVLLQEFWRSIA
jgi:pimeloyl-ACP methyl ester carboxylesterase